MVIFFLSIRMYRMYGDFLAEHPYVHSEYTYKCMVLANPTAYSMPYVCVIVSASAQVCVYVCLWSQQLSR
jgi:hypothetical protein